MAATLFFPNKEASFKLGGRQYNISEHYHEDVDALCTHNAASSITIPFCLTCLFSIRKKLQGRFS
jgi:predicted NAD-dependent protein-ADP-ribosyltransferase YbiA (DUF1768 family)